MSEDSQARGEYEAERDQYNIGSVGPGSAIGPGSKVEAENIAGGDININQGSGGDTGVPIVAIVAVVALVIVVVLVIVALAIARPAPVGLPEAHLLQALPV